jgi:hypothetical protein
VFSGRGRGRPRKNNANKVDPTSDEFFSQPDKDGGPIDTLIGLDEALRDVLAVMDIETFPVTKYLRHF